ncbi:MAG TPA: MurR/RpiR family transcriptional regulator [Jatrophihabitans sp.]|nr:MurR/RpiR family transcriptional regulator [Jatrophihabitans sp.]
MEVLTTGVGAPDELPARTVAELIRSRRAALTAAELRVAQALLADYPAAGLQPVAALAQHAGVSGPTVVRLVAKLGIGSYPKLQARLRAELSARSAAPADLLPSLPHADQVSPLLRRYTDAVGRAVLDILGSTDSAEMERATALLADRSRTVLLAGGRVSTALADYLARYLALVRPHVVAVPPMRAARSQALVDIGAESVLIVFDFRRYDAEVVEFGRAAAARGAALIVFTDPYLSPLAASAEVLLTAAVEGPAPLLTLAPALALAEALVLATVESLGPGVRERFEAFDDVDVRLRNRG